MSNGWFNQSARHSMAARKGSINRSRKYAKKRFSDTRSGLEPLIKERERRKRLGLPLEEPRKYGLEGELQKQKWMRQMSSR